MKQENATKYKDRGFSSKGWISYFGENQIFARIGKSPLLHLWLMAPQAFFIYYLIIIKNELGYSGTRNRIG